MEGGRSDNGDTGIDRILLSHSPRPASVFSPSCSASLSASLSLSTPGLVLGRKQWRQQEHKSLCRSDKIPPSQSGDPKRGKKEQRPRQLEWPCLLPPSPALRFLCALLQWLARLIRVAVTARVILPFPFSILVLPLSFLISWISERETEPARRDGECATREGQGCGARLHGQHGAEGGRGTGGVSVGLMMEREPAGGHVAVAERRCWLRIRGAVMREMRSIDAVVVHYTLHRPASNLGAAPVAP